MSESEVATVSTAQVGRVADTPRIRRHEAPLAVRTGRGLFWPRVAVLVAVGVLLPLVASGVGGYEARYTLTISIAYAIGILAFNVVSSTSGEVNLAAGGEMAIGAYVAAYFEMHHAGAPVAVAAGLLATLLVGFVLALGVARLRGVYTALATFALAFSIPDAVTFFKSFTGGGLGEYMLPFKVGGLSLAGGRLSADYIGMAVFVVVGVAWLAVLNGPSGRILLLLGDAEPALTAFGHRPFWLKVAVWSASGLLAGAAGILYGLTVGYLNPQGFTLYLSLYLLVGAVVGGTTSVLGALVGGALIGVIPTYMSGAQGGGEDFVLGALLVLVLVVGRRGVWPRVESGAVWCLSRWGRRGRQRAGVSSAEAEHG